VGGVPYLLQLADALAPASHIETHAYLILEYAMRRQLVDTGREITRGAQDETEGIFELLDRSEQKLFEIVDKHIQRNYQDIHTILGKVTQEVEAAGQAHKDGVVGVPSGFPALDRLLQGWQPSNLIILAARPGMGKSALLLTLLRNAALNHRRAVALFSLEMAYRELGKRLISMETGLAGGKLNSGQLTRDEWQSYFANTARLDKAPIYIDDSPSLSLFELRAKCRRLKSRHKVELVAVDYLQIMRGDGGNREQEIAYISRGLKSIAKELDIPILAACQLSRAVEVRGGDKRPQLSDLRESGAIEQDADLVLSVYRPEYYGFTQDEEGNSAQGLVEVSILKHRNGPLGKIQLRFKAERACFEEPLI
jgi:replicative DNA helicase